MKNKELIQMESEITKRKKEQGKFKYYGSNTEEGVDGNGYWGLEEDPTFKLLKADVDFIVMFIRRLESVAINFAETTGLESKGSLAQVLGSLFKEFTVLYPGRNYTGIKRDLEGYFLKLNEFDFVVPSEKLKDVDKSLIQYYKFVEGEPVFDQEKYDEENLI